MLRVTSDRFKKLNFIPIKEEVVKLKSPQDFFWGFSRRIKMPELSTIVREDVGKRSSEMIYFFQRMVKNAELKAYSVTLKKRKGITLTPTSELKEYQMVFVEDQRTGNMYNLAIHVRGGMIYNGSDSQTIYHTCVLEKLAQKFDPKKVTTGSVEGISVISIPQKMVTARLRVNYNEEWESGYDQDYVEGTKGNLVTEGEHDTLFEKVREFVKRE